MNFFSQIFRNKVFLATFFAWMVAQGIKVILGIIKNKRFDFRWFIDTGGMPSSHTAAVTAMATSVGITFGFDSPMFAMALIFTLVVMFDAQGVRRAAGKQAEILNKIMEDIQFRRKLEEDRLKELLGHTRFEVFAGAVVGVLIAVFFFR
ncbi:MAG: hypothetical protein COX49_02435 [bacterium (Candidatus Stahlbacteria) CG23_combo_of_CG06-09_8_20_14_all_40_9]|nr:MAG: hypothetical protein COX49_02435 [bacterium (Candidatus Stahlbacteria) CG23_combo_of_CG06-09_8_20_14_all_40_9]